MFTYESFETLGVFTLFRPIFVTFVILCLILFINVILPKTKSKIVNGFTVTSLSIVSIIVSGQLLFDIGIIADEINLGGDPVSFYMFIVIVGFGLINPVIYFIRHSEIKGFNKVV